MTATEYMSTGAETALAYAVAAERLFGGDTTFLNANRPLVPIFVSHLYQSLEISIKTAGIEAGLFTMLEARSRQTRSGHGIKELAELACGRFGSESTVPLVGAMTYVNANHRSATVLGLMISGSEAEKTRISYASRRLGYGEETEFSIIYPIAEWIEAVKETALKLPTAIEILRQWKASPSKSRRFMIRG